MLTEKQIIFLNNHVNGGNWTLKENDVVDIDDTIILSWLKLKEMPLKIGIAQGDFWADNNLFTSLKNFPSQVSRNFWCSYNQLTSLKDCPREIGGDFYCHYNQLTSLEYMPTKIEGKIYCHENPFILNDKLFEDLREIGGEKKIGSFNFLVELKVQIPIQFGITDKDVMEDIWQSYMKILEAC